MAPAARQAEDRDVDVLTQVRNQALRASIQEAAAALVDVLPMKIAAYTIGVKDTKVHLLPLDHALAHRSLDADLVRSGPRA